MIVAIDRLEHFVGLLEHERLQRVDRLLAIPRTAVGPAERGHDLDEPDELAGGAGGGRSSGREDRWGGCVYRFTQTNRACWGPACTGRQKLPRRRPAALAGFGAPATRCRGRAPGGLWAQPVLVDLPAPPRRSHRQ